MSKAWRYQILGKKGLNTYTIRYGKGCQCSWLTWELRVPLEEVPDTYIRGVLEKL